jgi:hypothetical protein
MTAVLHRATAYQLWIVWSVAATGLLMAKPWGLFSWDEWIAVAAPLLLIHPMVSRKFVLIGGLAVSGAAWAVVGGPAGSFLELACLWGVLTVGTFIAFAATRSSHEGQSEPGSLAPLDTEGLFFDALNRELCRARRDEGSFAVLSVDQQIVGHSDTPRSLRRVCELLDAELRAYADIAQVGDRALALVPGLADNQCVPMLLRLSARAEAYDCGEIRIGLARFPQDAVCAKDLIDIADRKRLVKGVPPDSIEGSILVHGQQMLS